MDRLIAVFTCFVLLQFAIVLPVAGVSPNTDGLSDAEAVLKKFGTSVVQERDLSAEVRTFLKSDPGRGHPGYIKTDLNGDGIADIALLTQDRDSDEVTVHVYICTNVCTRKKKELVGAIGDVFLRLVAAGTVVKETEAVPGKPKSQRLKGSGVKVLNYGKSEIVYFWDAKRNVVRSVTTGD